MTIQSPTKTTKDTAIYNAETPKAGHNSGFAREQLISIVERVERLEEEQQGLAEDKREVYSEAKGMGFDTAIIRKVIARRKMDPAERDEVDALVELYETNTAGVERPK